MRFKKIPVVTGFLVKYSFRPYHGPGVDSTPVKMSTRNIS